VQANQRGLEAFGEPDGPGGRGTGLLGTIEGHEHGLDHGGAPEGRK